MNEKGCSVSFATIRHHSGVVLSVNEPSGTGLTNITLMVGEAIKISLPLDSDELKTLRDGIDKAIDQSAGSSGWHENIRGPEYYK